MYFVGHPVYFFTLTVDIKNLLSEFEDIHSQVFLPKFHETLTLRGKGGVDSIFISADPLSLKLNQFCMIKSNFHKTLQENSW